MQLVKKKDGVLEQNGVLEDKIMTDNEKACLMFALIMILNALLI